VNGKVDLAREESPLNFRDEYGLVAKFGQWAILLPIALRLNDADAEIQGGESSAQKLLDELGLL
jgi:hypothetical protein